MPKVKISLQNPTGNFWIDNGLVVLYDLLGEGEFDEINIRKSKKLEAFVIASVQAQNLSYSFLIRDFLSETLAYAGFNYEDERKLPGCWQISFLFHGFKALQTKIVR